MADKDLFQDLPKRRIKPVDGMAVTAQVWEEAHDYHRQHLRFHDQLLHGPGIVAGLGVVASDPPDSSVYVLPGVAVDPEGRMIVVPEPVAFELGSAHGLLYLVLYYEESRPVAGDQEDSPLYVQPQFGIEVATKGGDGRVELARIRRRERDAALGDAKDGEHPGPNEIDLRFRRQIGAAPRAIASMAVCYTGGLKEPGQAHGANDLARSLRRSGCAPRVWVDDRVALAPGLEEYTLVYLVGRDAFQLSRDEMSALYAYLQAGGTLFFESCRRQGEGLSPNAVVGDDPPADASFLDLLASMGLQLKELPADHPLLVEPHLFAAPPPGFESGESTRVLAAEGVILSTGDYGCLWQRKRRGRTASREEIRAAIEWGENLVTYALQRAEKGALQG